ncbi:phosphotransferase [Clostridium sp. MCC353]|uniref:sugar phosphate nucleotidyltransferase n=1 Tax=Clostridium sp. MCC353 TaxID=2592646 RepID=UPI001C020DF3|nr:sugar phosphate nucleotidyltransferase [Clostridium sp. MCC353]MBT9777880.1 phosphotransferase [Clostridium sp. MCC353]
MDRLGLICRCVWERPEITQRELASQLDVSLGTINNLVKECIANDYISLSPDNKYHYILLEKGKELLESYKVDGAVIIAAGFGSRFVPLTYETPKGLLEVFGERMIERQIKQLHEAGIYNITIVVGYLKEKFEYLIDKYGVKLLYNSEYSHKNTLATIWHAREILRGHNMYVLSSDNWMRNNMYHTYECGTWYSAIYGDGDTSEWCLNFNKKGRITEVCIGGHNSWFMYGPVFWSKDFSQQFLDVLEEYYKEPGTEQFYWEQVLLDLIDKFEIYINKQSAQQVYEFENLEELRLFDPKYQTRSDNAAMELVASVFQVPESEITEIRCLKAGMTNKSFLFCVNQKHYICRIPGPGTELLINREQEKNVYDAVSGLGLTEHIVYFDGETGYKISEYYEGAVNSNARDWNEVASCMKALHSLHDAAIQVDHRFDVRERIIFYEKLCKSQLSHEAGENLLFEDYKQVRANMIQLLDELDRLNRPEKLSHIDSVADNFLFLPDGSIRLIDWEYSGMCDPLIDVAMCAIYSYYDEEETERLIQIYFGRNASEEESFVIYSYMALGGFLWTLWAIYKSTVGEEFGEYTLIMYRYAKKYYRKALTKL